MEDANEHHYLPPLDIVGDAPQDEEFEQEDDEEEAAEKEEGQKPPIIASYKPKLIEIIKNLHSHEIKIYSEASKEFIALLRGDAGGGILHGYVQSSPKCLELVEAWRLHQGQPGLAHILLLVAAILDHPDGKSWASGIRRSLDMFARSIFESKLDDISAELKSQESRRQSAALSLLASIVRRGFGLASEVAKSFDKLPSLSKISGVQKKGEKKREKKARRGTSISVRQAFVRFAISFLEVGNPRLLRAILRQREMYAGVLRGLGSDDTETVVYVLSALRDKVLTEGSLVPPGLRSVLFGSVVLEQLSYISGNLMGGPAADIAHEVLVKVCTDPANGLMPGLNLKGNEKRLLELMKKLKATEVGYHRKLLLAIVNKRPSLGSAYMDEFPYHLEPRSSSLWFSAISLAADMISSINADTAVTSLASHSHGLQAVNDSALQSVLKCIIPRACTRSVINKGLLHSDTLVRHGSLRLILESLKSLGNIIKAIDDMVESMCVEKVGDSCGEEITNIHGLPGFDCFTEVDKCCGDKIFPLTKKLGIEKWVSLKQCIQDEVRAVLPDPQVLLKLLSSLSNRNLKHFRKNLKRSADIPEIGVKKLKSDTTSEIDDIVIGGIDGEPITHTPEVWTELRDVSNKQDLDVEKDHTVIIHKIWGLNEHNMIGNEPKDAESFFHSKLLDVLTLYLRVEPIAFEKSYDFFQILRINPLSLSIDQQQSLLSLLIEYIGQSPGGRTPARIPKFMYKHLQRLINMLIYSQVRGIQDQAYVLTRAAMISSGAFDQNFSEIDAWLFFLPGYKTNASAMECHGAEAFHELSPMVVSFLCDAVSTVGNNLFQYLNHMHKLISQLEDLKDESPGFSPLICCILQKCLRLLDSDSGTFKLYEKSMISLYVCNTISLILQSQADMKMLPGLINLILTENCNNYLSIVEDSKDSLCEWRPLKNLLCFARKILQHQCFDSFSISESAIKGHDSSFFAVLAKVKEFLGQENAGQIAGVAVAFSSSVICASPDEILKNFPLVLTVAQQHFRSHLPFLSSVIFLEPSFLAKVANLWPDMFFSGLEMIERKIKYNCGSSDEHLRGSKESVHSSTISIFPDILDSTESAATVFYLFLRHAPFYALFSAILGFGRCGMLEVLRSTKMLDLLMAKLSEGSIDNLLSSLRFVLFWTYQILSAYKAKPSGNLEELFQMCFTLVDFIFERILVMTTHPTELKMIGTLSVTEYVEDVVGLIFHHPVVTLLLRHPLCSSRDLANETLELKMDILLNSSKPEFHTMDQCILQLLSKVFEFVLALLNGCGFSSKDNPFPKSVLEGPRNMFQEAVTFFREKIDFCVGVRDFAPVLPNFLVFHVLTRLASPFELLELVNWMLSKLDSNISGCTSAFESAASMCLHVADGALDMLYNYLRQPNQKSAAYQFWGSKARRFNAAILQNVHYKFLDFAVRSNIERADVCVLKAVNFIYRQRSGSPQPAFLPLYMMLSRMIINYPLDLLLHCFYPTTKVKARTLLLLIEVSPLHMSLFGQIFLGILKKDLSFLDALNLNGAWSHRREVADDDFYYGLSENDFVLLLPAALSYLRSDMHTFKRQAFKVFESVPMLYSRILLNGFSNWKAYVSRSIFQEEYHTFAPSSLEDFRDFVDNSLLGKAVDMLRCFLILNGSSFKKQQRLKIFDSMYPHSSELLDCDLEELNACLDGESLRLVNEFSAKISFTRLLFLSTMENSEQILGTEMERGHNKMAQETGSKRLNCAKLRFMNILVNTYDWIVRNRPKKNDCSAMSCTSDNCCVFKFLERSILRNIIQFSEESQTYLTQLPSIPFVNPLIRSCLLHRFEDHVTLKAIRCILVALSGGRFSSNEILELLLAHSLFVSTVLSSDAICDPSAFTPCGTLLQTVPSILKSLDVSSDDQNTLGVKGIHGVSPELRYNQCALEKRRLELFKLLRVVFHIRKRQHVLGLENVKDFDSREVLLLLLSAYGATMGETDLEILHLMHEIESTEGSEYEKIAEMDYLWGSAVMKIRKELALDRTASFNKTADCGTIEERRKLLFRENIPVDSKLCVITILNFSYERSSITAPMFMERLQLDDFIECTEMPSLKDDIIQPYDPAFILRFSIHNLMMGYIEPIEFSRLGLLAITLVSISSPDEELRKLGYESLGRFRLALENYQKSKDALLLQLLLTYLQNGIAEPWQKIPSVIAIFVAEASFIVLDPSHRHFSTISNLLMHSPKVNLKNIPLFDMFFGSYSVHFKLECLWILQLLFVGLNLNDDAQIYMRNKILELLLSFHASSLSDPETKILVLQILKKSVKLPLLAPYLIKDCGLLPWLSSLLSFYGERLTEDHEKSSLWAMELVLKVINDAISSKTITEWLQECALEQLSELSSYLHTMVVGSLKFLKENVLLVNSMLHVMVSTLMLSQKRNTYQPHFTFSLQGLFQLYLAIGAEFSNMEYNLTIELGLKVILSSAPMPVVSRMDRARLLKLVTWAISAALRSFHDHRSLTDKPDSGFLRFYEGHLEKEFLISKLLQWATASVILGSISNKSFKMKTEFSTGRSNFKTLQSLLEEGETGEKVGSADEALAFTVLYLQQLLKRDHSGLPSVVSALCLLLLSSESDSIDKRYLEENCKVIASLCSKIRCPAEANPAWTWSFDQPWQYFPSGQNQREQIEEMYACQSLLVIFSNALGGRPSGLPVLSHQDLEHTGLFEWERDIILGSRT